MVFFLGGGGLLGGEGEALEGGYNGGEGRPRNADAASPVGE